MLVGTVSVTVFPAAEVRVCGAPPFILYVKVYGGVADPPVNVISGAVLLTQTVAEPFMVAVGRGFTTTVALPETIPERQPVFEMDARLYTPGMVVNIWYGNAELCITGAWLMPSIA